MSEIDLRKGLDERHLEGLLYVRDELQGAHKQALFQFENGYGASVISSMSSYGIELAVIRFEEGTREENRNAARRGDFVHNWEFSDALDGHELVSGDGIAGWLNLSELSGLLDTIRELPSAYAPREVDENDKTKELEQ